VFTSNLGAYRNEKFITCSAEVSVVSMCFALVVWESAEENLKKRDTLSMIYGVKNEIVFDIFKEYYLLRCSFFLLC
jgi:hypothetical protein